MSDITFVKKLDAHISLVYISRFDIRRCFTEIITWVLKSKWVKNK